MHINLDALKEDIQNSLSTGEFVVFHGYARSTENLPAVYWDTESHPGHEEFLRTAKAAGVSMIVFHQQEFSAEMVDDAVAHLEGSDLAAEDYRLIQGRLEELRRFNGFTCSMELSFDYQGRAYIYELRAEWYEEYTDIVDELEFGVHDGEDDEDPPIGGYFSKN